jgi:hypothetical protein
VVSSFGKSRACRGYRIKEFPRDDGRKCIGGWTKAYLDGRNQGNVSSFIITRNARAIATVG